MLTLGSDPEVLLTHQGSPVLPTGIIPGDKNNPYRCGGGVIHVDNVAAEYAIPPVSVEEDWIQAHKDMLAHLKSFTDPEDVDIQIVPSAHFDMDMLLSDAQAMEFGCSPDRDVYTGYKNPSPDPNTTLRGFGGHIHIGSSEVVKNRKAMVKAMDLFLGVPATIMDPDKERQLIYGGFGKFRSKPYGIEYRGLSNFWIKSEDTLKWAWRNTLRAVDSLDHIDYTQITRELINSDPKGLIAYYDLEVI